jgi:hypothetical protein
MSVEGNVGRDTCTHDHTLTLEELAGWIGGVFSFFENTEMKSIYQSICINKN